MITSIQLETNAARGMQDSSTPERNATCRCAFNAFCLAVRTPHYKTLT